MNNKIIEEKLNYIKSKGFIINDEKYIVEYLDKVCLYKLSKYFINFRDQKNVDFKEVINNYLFDIELRNLNLLLLEHIENNLKVQIVKVIGENYLNESVYNSKFVKNRLEFINEKIEYFRKHDVDIKKIDKNNQINFNIFISKLTFGELVKVYRDLDNNIKYEINKFYNFKSIKYFENWIFGMRYLRNLCSHGENVFNRKYEDTLKGENINKLLGLQFNNNYTSYLIILDLFNVLLKIDIDIYGKILKLKNQYKIENKKNASPYLGHLSKDKEAWGVLVQGLYGFYIKKSKDLLEDDERNINESLNML